MGKKRVENAEELNLVPIMNLVTILIPFLLMAAEFVSLAVIDSTLPAIGGDPSTEPTPEPEKKPLNLTVVITDAGYTVAGSAAVLSNRAEGADATGPTIPCREAGCPAVTSYDMKELRSLLGKIKDEFPEEENVILVPESRVEYEVIIATMDATRDDPDNKVDGKARMLFPYVVIAGGAN